MHELSVAAETAKAGTLPRMESQLEISWALGLVGPFIV
jgi:hypothetical protein